MTEIGQTHPASDSAGKALQVECIDAFDAIDRAEWTTLWESIPAAHVYQTYDWYALWARHCARGHRLCIALARVDGRLVAAAPMMIQTQSRFGVVRRSIMTFLSSHSEAYPLDQGPLLAPDAPEGTLDALAAALLNLSGYAVVHAELHEVGAPATRLLEAMARRSGRTLHTRVVAQSHMVELAETYEDFVAGLGYKTRRNVRNYNRKFIEGGEGREVVKVETPEQMTRLIEAMRSQKNARFQEQSGASTLDDETFFNFLKAVAAAFLEQGRIDGFMAMVDGKIAATQLVCHDDHDHSYSYNSSFDPEFRDLRLPYVLSSARFESAIAQGYRVIDLSTGHDNHKKMYSKDNIRELVEQWVVVRPLGNLAFALMERLKGIFRNKPGNGDTADAS